MHRDQWPRFMEEIHSDLGLSLLTGHTTSLYMSLFPFLLHQRALGDPTSVQWLLLVSVWFPCVGLVSCAHKAVVVSSETGSPIHYSVGRGKLSDFSGPAFPHLEHGDHSADRKAVGRTQETPCVKRAAHNHLLLAPSWPFT